MAETQTPHYPTWIKPDLGGDAATWGNVLNTTFDAIDSVVYANQQAGVPIGAITMFGGASSPANWLICDGSSRATTGTYAALFAAVGYAFGGSGANFNLPNLQSVFPLGAGAGNALGSAGGAATVTLNATMIPAHTHVATQPAHSHSASQTPHSHQIINGDVIISPGPGLTSGGPNFSLAIGQTDTQQPAVNIGNAQPAITVNANTGGGAAHPNMPPYVAINFIIRYM